MVESVQAEMVSASSVRVSWERLNISELTGYIVYYSQTDKTQEEGRVTVSSLFTSVLIDNLSSYAEYQFQVVAVVEVEGEVLMGQRSMLNSMSIITPLDRNMVSLGIALPLLHMYT